MGYIPYPERPQTPNALQTIGGALMQGGKIFDDANENQFKMRQSMEEMTQKRAAAILAQQEAELRAKQLEQDTRLKAEADQRAHDFAIEAAKGKVISPTLAKDPSLANRTRPAAPAPTVPGGPTSADLADLSNVQGMNLPAQPVQAGGDATAMMGAALDNQPADPTAGRVPYDRHGLVDLALQTRQIDAKDYMAATKPPKDDFFNNPELLADYQIQSQDPGFKTLADGYATDPQKFGPMIQNWAAHHGYTGQKWWNAELSRMIHQVPRNTMTDMTSPEELQYWAGEYAKGNVDPNFISSLFSSRGGNKAAKVGAIIRGAQDVNGDVNVSGDIRGAKSANDQTNRRTVATIDNVANRMGRLLELSNSIDRTRFPTLNKFLLSSERGAGAMQAQMLQLNEALTGEELSQVFGQGSAGSDAKLHLAQEIASLGDLPVDVAQAKIKEIEGALENRRSTFTGIMGRYGMPKPGAASAGPAASPAASGAPSPGIPAKGTRKALDGPTAADYLKRAGGDRQKAKQMLAKDGYNING